MVLPCVNCEFTLRPSHTIQLLLQSVTPAGYVHTHFISMHISSTPTHLILQTETAVYHHCRYMTPSWSCSSINFSLCFSHKRPPVQPFFSPFSDLSLFPFTFYSHTSNMALENFKPTHWSTEEFQQLLDGLSTLYTIMVHSG